MPEVNLNNECCDLREEDCSSVIAFGQGFSTVDPIYVRIQLEEVFFFKSNLFALD